MERVWRKDAEIDYLHLQNLSRLAVGSSTLEQLQAAQAALTSMR